MRRWIRYTAVLASLLVLLPAAAASAATSSQNVALVPSAQGQAGNGGILPLTAFPNGYAPAFTEVTPQSIRDDAADPLAGFDTVVLVQVCDIGAYLSNPQFKSRLEGFVSNGGKLLIWDSECQNTDYSNFVFPFTTSNPGQLGANGQLTIVESNNIGNSDPNSPSYINAQAISDDTDAVGDANVFTSFDQNWCAGMNATNALGFNGPTLVYARDGAGLVVYTGLDMDLMGTTFDASDPSGSVHLARMWLLQLLQGFNPTSQADLPCGVKVFGLALAPKTGSNPVNTPHTVTATVSQSGVVQPGVTVTFTVTAGPNAGVTGTAVTDQNGVASFTYTGGSTGGTDTIQASAALNGADGSTTVSDTATKDWIAPSTPSGGGATTTTPTTTTTAAPAPVTPTPTPPPATTAAATVRAAVAGVPRACVSSRFMVRVRVGGTATSVRVRVLVDGKVVARSTRRSFTVAINGKRLKAGRHRVVVQARGGGQVSTKRFSFRRCAPVRPTLTG